MASFPDVKTAGGLKALNEYLLTRSYIDGFQASRDDLAVYSALSGAPDATTYPHVARWYKHIQALLGASFPGAGSGVSIAGAAAAAAAAPAAAGAEKEEEDMGKDIFDDDDDDDLDLFGEMTEEEKQAAEEKKAAVEAKLAKSRANAVKAKSMIVLDVKPWDDTTDMAALEAEVRAIQKDGLLWGACKLVPIGYGIKKLQITAIIEDVKIESMDAIIEEELVKDGESENIQSIDIVAFNKL